MAAVREIREELGVGLALQDLEPVSFASDKRLPLAIRQPHVILLYACRRWTGEIQCLDGEELAWFEPETIAGLEMPPLDYPLARGAQIFSF